MAGTFVVNSGVQVMGAVRLVAASRVHAVLQESVEFQNLKYAVIDEQHKFGVRQRSVLKKFGSPNILQMSATPIPRSMALAFF